MSNPTEEETPTTEQVRDLYTVAWAGWDHTMQYDPEAYAEFDRWLADHDAAVLEKWADFQDSTLTGPLAYAVEDSDRAEVARWTSAARAYAAGMRSGPYRPVVEGDNQ